MSKIKLPIQTAADLHRLMRYIDILRDLGRHNITKIGTKNFLEAVQAKPRHAQWAVCHVADFAEAVLSGLELSLMVEVEQVNESGDGKE